MRIKTGEYVTTAVSHAALPAHGQREVALVGRSNVGKSSLINALCQNGKLARTSSAPGKTRTLNLYHINRAFYFADLPGYGFAQAPQGEKQRWAAMIERYFESRSQLARALLLADMRHPPTAEDVAMAAYLRHYHIPFTVVATKSDKVPRSKRPASIAAICRALIVLPTDVLPFSAQTGEGRDALLTALGLALGLEEEGPPPSES